MMALHCEERGEKRRRGEGGEMREKEEKIRTKISLPNSLGDCTVPEVIK